MWKPPLHTYGCSRSSVGSGTVTWPIYIFSPFGFKYIVLKVTSSSLVWGCACRDCISSEAGLALISEATVGVNLATRRLRTQCFCWDRLQKCCYQQFRFRFDRMSDKRECGSQRQMGGGCIGYPPTGAKTLKQPIIMLWQETSLRFFFSPNIDGKRT